MICNNANIVNWNDLPTFLAIVDSGTLAGAARALRVNHSTVFRRLNALEDALGTRLFDRLPDGYVPTASGERLAVLARRADDTFRQIERELAGRDLEPSGVVRVTAAPNIARTIVAEAVARLRVTHPLIEVVVLAGDTDYDLGRREADIAVRATTSPPKQLVGRKVADLYWSVCRAAGDEAASPAAGHDPTHVDQLRGLSLVGAEGNLRRVSAFQWLERNYSEAIVARAGDLSTMAALARVGVGYVLLPSDQPERGIERVLRIPDLSGQLWVLTHPDLRGATRHRVVWDALVQAGLAFEHVSDRS